MTALVMPDRIVVIPDSMANDGGIFPCGHCTTKEIAVYHNVIGVHRHVTTDELLCGIESSGFPTSQ